MPHFLFLAGVAALLCATGADNKVAPPSHISYDERDLRYNPDWKTKEVYLQGDLDDKPGAETAITFIASFKPKHETNDEKKDPFDMAKPVIPIVQNYAFAQIYRQDAGGHYECVKTINGMDRPQTLRLLEIDGKKPTALAVISPGGENYTNIIVLRWQNGGYRTLLDESGSGKAEILSDKNPVSLKIGEKTWRWDGEKNRFEKEKE